MNKQETVFCTDLRYSTAEVSYRYKCTTAYHSVKFCTIINSLMKLLQNRSFFICAQSINLAFEELRIQHLFRHDVFERLFSIPSFKVNRWLS